MLLVCLLFPWQSLLNSRVLQASSEVRGGMPVTTQPTTLASATTLPPLMQDVRIPGALYTWPELVRDYDFSNSNGFAATVGSFIRSKSPHELGCVTKLNTTCGGLKHFLKKSYTTVIRTDQPERAGVFVGFSTGYSQR